MKMASSKRIRFWVSSILLGFGSFWVYKAVGAFCDKQTDGFSVLGITSNREVNPAWNTRDLTNEERVELDVALNQNYSYLARGNQAFAFISDDGRYILKFFRQRKLSPPAYWKWLQSLPTQEKRRTKKIWKRGDKLQRDFESYRIAFDDLKEESGLIYVHLNHTDWIKKDVTIFDRLHIAHKIPIDKFDFVIQKRADLVYPTIDRLMAEGNIEGAKKALSSIARLFLARCEKGIFDSPPDLDKNFGFIDDTTAVQIDVGKFKYTPVRASFESTEYEGQAESFSRVEMPEIKREFINWLFGKSPELCAHFLGEYQMLCDLYERSLDLSVQ